MLSVNYNIRVKDQQDPIFIRFIILPISRNYTYKLEKYKLLFYFLLIFRAAPIMVVIKKAISIKKFFLVVLYGLVAFNKVSSEKTGWLCDSAFYEDTPAVYFDGQEITNACVSMRKDLTDKKALDNENFRSCTLLPDRQCIASR